MQNLDNVTKDLLNLLHEQYVKQQGYKDKLSFASYEIPKKYQDTIKIFLDDLISNGFIKDYKESITGNFTVSITKQCVLYFAELE